MCNSVASRTAGRELNRRDNEQFFNCKSKCCTSCSYCARKFSKERNKSRGSSLSLQKKQIKICERCFLCHSIVLCKTCNKCSKCGHKSACRGQTSKLLGNLAGSGCRSESCSNAQRGLCPPLSDLAELDKVSHSHKLLWQSSQEPQPVRGITSAYEQKCNRTGTQTQFTRVLQQTIFSPKTQQQVETNTRPEQFEPIPQGRKIQNGDTGNHQDIPLTRGVGHLDGLQGRLLPHPNTGTVQEILEISCPGPDLQFKALPFGLSTAPMEFTVIAKEVKLMAIRKGIRIHQYLDDWLVRATSHRLCLEHTQSLVTVCQKLGWLVNMEKSIGSDPHQTGGKAFRKKY